jgi:hypothetical protein
MIRDLFVMISKGPVTSLELGAAGGDHAKLRYWGLATQGRDGRWEVTRRGRDFALGHIPIPEIAYVFNGVVHSYSEKQVYVRDRMGKRFDYDQLMEQYYERG